ncbi:MAG: MBOAT family O-acyltransferase, partial [Bacteroidia bacterium]
MIERSDEYKRRKFWLYISIIINVGFLALFKYFNFFIETFASFLNSIGINFNIHIIQVIVPIGISFYTFHGLSYIIDIYQYKIKSEKNIIDYSLFVSYFPLLVAGPIERANRLLPQLKTVKVFDQGLAVRGLKQILYGLFKKIVIADNCGIYTNDIFNNYYDFSGVTLFVGAFLFAVQIYADFSAYSDIASGTSRLFGIQLIRNFSYPYFSRNIAEFWRRWHISLSSWFRDYLYIPLGGGKGSTLNRVRNVLIIFLVSGLWHGANWTFVFWGFLNALFVLPFIISKSRNHYTNIVAQNSLFPSLYEFIQIISTFLLTTLIWIFFRIKTINESFTICMKIFNDLFNYRSFVETYDYLKANSFYEIFLLLFFFTVIEW